MFKWSEEAYLQVVTFITKQGRAAIGNVSSHIDTFSLEDGPSPDMRVLRKDPTGSSSAKQAKRRCTACKQPFGLTRYRYTCLSCQHCFCSAHLPFTTAVPSAGHVVDRVCEGCFRLLEHTAHLQRMAWRMARVQACLDGRLVPYTLQMADPAASKAIRGAFLALMAAQYLPLTAGYIIPFITAKFLIRHGAITVQSFFLRRELAEAAGMLQQLAGPTAMQELSLVDLVGGFYYLLADQRSWRGKDPESERRQHLTSSSLPDGELEDLLKYAPWALRVVYEETASDVQRFVDHLGHELLCAHVESVREQPAWLLAIQKSDKRAILAIRGTSNLHDVLTDMSAEERPFVVDEAEVVTHLDRWTIPILTAWRRDGDSDDEGTPGEVVYVEDPLEGVVEMEEMQTLGLSGRCSPDAPASDPTPEPAPPGTSSSSSSSSSVPGDAPPKTVPSLGSGTPPLRGAAHGGMASSAQWLLREVGSCLQVLHEKGYAVVLTGHSLGGATATILALLLRSVIPTVRAVCFGAPPVLSHELAEACDGFVSNVVLRDDVVPRASVRNAVHLVEKLACYQDRWREVWRQDRAAVANRTINVWEPRWRRAPEELQAPDPPTPPDRPIPTPTPDENALAAEVEELVQREAALLGEAGPPPLPEAVSAADGAAAATPELAAADCAREPLTSDCAVPDDAAELEHGVEGSVGGPPSDGDAPQSGAPSLPSSPRPPNPRPVNLGPKQTLYIAGRAIHLYFWRGIYQAAVTHRGHPTLNRVELYPNMVADHTGAKYMEALQIVKAARQARQAPPRWAAFDEAETCACCSSDFTWNCTSHSAAQQALQRKNCYHCGALVCPECSTRERAAPDFGLHVPRRICDRCFLHLGDLYHVPDVRSCPRPPPDPT